MERRALTIPFTVDKDNLVCVMPVFGICVNLSAFSVQHELLLILARCCSDACFMAGIVNCADHIVFVIWDCFIGRLFTHRPILLFTMLLYSVG